MSIVADSVRQKVHHLADHLPDDATWADVEYSMSIVRDIGAGLNDSKSERVIDTKTLREQYGLPE